MVKEYKIKTIEDILKAVTEENINNFIADFHKWLHVRKGIEKLAKDSKLIFAVEYPEMNTFHWVDDGKNEANINIEVVQK